MSDYPELVDIEVDKKIQAQNDRQKERAQKRKKNKKFIREIEIKDMSSEKSGLEELVTKVFSAIIQNFFA